VTNAFAPLVSKLFILTHFDRRRVAYFPVVVVSTGTLVRFSASFEVEGAYGDEGAIGLRRASIFRAQHVDQRHASGQDLV
jgi:hypothetical protein